MKIFATLAFAASLASCARIQLPNAKTVVARGNQWTVSWTSDASTPAYLDVSYRTANKDGKPVNPSEELKMTTVSSKAGHVDLPARFPTSSYYQAVLREAGNPTRIIATSAAFHVV